MINSINKMEPLVKPVIPIFFATDDNYIPYLAVAFESLIANSSDKYKYVIKVLNNGVSENNVQKIMKYTRDYVEIEFVDVAKRMESISDKLHTRDYYSKTTYFRLFIPAMYPQYKKCLYLDCDIVIKGDISKLYNINIGKNLVGAVTDEFVERTPELNEYAIKALGLENVRKYFNAGILIMNLEQFRNQNFENQFIDLLSKYKFTVAQDQDYLNVICKGKVFYISNVWDKMPMPGGKYDENKLQLIHYNLAWKPWHLDNILFADYFWEYAKKTEYYDFIKNIKDNYTKEMQDRDLKQCQTLMCMAYQEANSDKNYYNLFVKPSKDGGNMGILGIWDGNSVPVNG